MERNRKLTRKKDYDYNEHGSYFITICTKNRQNFFGEIIEGKMQLSEIGIIAKNNWEDIVNHFNNIQLDEFVVMPDHVHGIIHILPEHDDDVGKDDVWNDIVGKVGKEYILSLRNKKIMRMNARLPVIIRTYKSSVTRIVNANYIPQYFQWQQSYYDRIIRNPKELNNIRQYIYSNPLRWVKDEENIKVYI